MTENAELAFDTEPSLVEEEDKQLPTNILIKDEFSQSYIKCENYHFVFEGEDIPEHFNKSQSILIELNHQAEQVDKLECFSNQFVAYDAQFTLSKDLEDELVSEIPEELYDEEDKLLIVKGLFNASLDKNEDNPVDFSQRISQKYQQGIIDFDAAIQSLEEWFTLRNQHLKGILDLEESIFKAKDVKQEEQDPA